MHQKKTQKLHAKKSKPVKKDETEEEPDNENEDIEQIQHKE